MRIRKYKASDNKKLSYLIQKCILEVNSSDYTERQIEFLRREFSPAKVHAKFTSRTTYVAEVKDTLLACITFNEGEIGSLFVNPRFHHQGVATNLLDKIEKYALTHNFSTVWVNSSKTAVTFYKKRKYKMKKRISHKEGGVTFVMKKVLK